MMSASLLLEAFTPKGMRLDLDRCLALIQSHGNSIPNSFIEALIIAEDHRSSLHPGIDAIALARALWVRVKTGRVHGASTIEQQYVRVVSNRYERTILRKLREQIIALMLSRRVDKKTIASAYLSIAFYGSGFIGIEGLKSKFGQDLSKVPFLQILRTVAQLKYPCPRNPSAEWHSKVSARVEALLIRIDSTANKRLQPTAKWPFRLLLPEASR